MSNYVAVSITNRLHDVMATKVFVSCIHNSLHAVLHAFVVETSCNQLIIVAAI